VQSRKRSLTVAGQWRIFTALPEHPTSKTALRRFNHGQTSSVASHIVVAHRNTHVESHSPKTKERRCMSEKQKEKYKSCRQT
jgi:hypothetical protein